MARPASHQRYADKAVLSGIRRRTEAGDKHLVQFVNFLRQPFVLSWPICLIGWVGIIEIDSYPALTFAA